MRRSITSRHFVDFIKEKIPKFTPVTHCIFDMDGLILDTEKIYWLVYSMLARKYGKKFTTDLGMKVTGKSEKEASAIIVKELGLTIKLEEFYAQKIAMQNPLLADSELKPGVERLLRHFHAKGVPMAIATSSNQDGFDNKTAKHKELFKLFHHIVWGNTDPDVKHGKPAPDIFLVCCSRFAERPLPIKCVVFEDSPNGIIGARAAGMQAVMVPESTTPLELCKKAGSTLIIRSLNDFQPELFSLPPFRKLN